MPFFKPDVERRKVCICGCTRRFYDASARGTRMYYDRVLCRERTVKRRRRRLARLQ